jgi:hypothetical protein
MKTTKSYLILASEDPQGLKNIPLNLGTFKDKRKARKAMIDQATKDLTHGHFYFYHLLEQKTIIHETFPNTQQSE